MELISAWLAQSPCNKLFSADVIRDNDISFIESLSLGEDLVFCLDYYSRCNSQSIICINVPTYNYVRCGKESLDNKYYHDLLDIDEKVYSRLKECIVSWKADEKQINIYNNSRFFRYTNALSNTYREGNKSTSKEKRRINNNILKSKEFKEALEKVTVYIHPIHKFAYKSGSWFLVNLAYKITGLKKYLKRG
jgi:hypothetical protein